MKTLFVFLTLIFSVAAYAQNSLEQLAQQVKQLVNQHGDRLSGSDELTVRRNLRAIVNTFKVNGYGTGPGLSYICDSGNNQLRELSSGRMIYDFIDMSDCQAAMANIKVGKNFCESSSNTMRSPQGDLVYDFNDLSTCQKAIETVHRVGKFCEYGSNTLRDAQGRLLYDFNSATDCDRALED